MCTEVTNNVGGKMYMKEVEWQVQEQFVFQPTLQKPQSIKQLQVTPQFTEESVEGRPKISGIYHVAMTCTLSDEQMDSMKLEDEHIMIDTIDQQGNDGYFEYAVPFHIDFPPEAANAVQVNVHEAHGRIGEKGDMIVTWDVKCMYGVEGIQKERQSATTETKQPQEVEQDKKSETKERQVSLEEHEEEAQSETLEEKTEVVEEEADIPQLVSDDHVLSFFQQLADGTSKKSFRTKQL